MYTHANGPDKLSDDGERKLKQLLSGKETPDNVIHLEHVSPAPAPEGVVCHNGVCSLGTWKPTRKAA